MNTAQQTGQEQPRSYLTLEHRFAVEASQKTAQELWEAVQRLEQTKREVWERRLRTRLRGWVPFPVR